jgi:hypothetical protein
MWVHMTHGVCCDMHVVSPVMAVTRQVQKYNAVGFSEIVVS